MANAGLLIVDHVHFQYNGFMLGMLVWSAGLLRQGHILKAAIMYTVVLNFKHIFIYVAPVYFVHLLADYCFELVDSGNH